MRETEVRVINGLRESANAMVQVAVTPLCRASMLETRPLRLLNPGPNGGESWFTFGGSFGVAVHGPRGATCTFSPLQPGELVRVTGGRGGGMRITPDAVRLGGGRFGVRHALDVPRLLTVDWLVDDVVIATLRDVNQGSIAAASFDEALWFSVTGPFHSSLPTRYVVPPGAARVVVQWDRLGGQGGRDIFLFEAS